MILTNIVFDMREEENCDMNLLYIHAVSQYQIKKVVMTNISIRFKIINYITTS